MAFNYQQALLNQQKQTIPTPVVKATTYVPQTAAGSAVKPSASVTVNKMPVIQTPTVNPAQTANGAVKIQQQAPVVPIPAPNVAPSLSPVANVPVIGQAQNAMPTGWQDTTTSPSAGQPSMFTPATTPAQSGTGNIMPVGWQDTASTASSAAAAWIAKNSPQSPMQTKAQIQASNQMQPAYSYGAGGRIVAGNANVRAASGYTPQTWALTQPGPSNLGGGPTYMSGYYDNATGKYTTPGQPTAYWYGSKPPARERQTMQFPDIMGSIGAGLAAAGGVIDAIGREYYGWSGGGGSGGGGSGGGSGGGGGYDGYNPYIASFVLGLSNWRYGF